MLLSVIKNLRSKKIFFNKTFVIEKNVTFALRNIFQSINYGR